MQMPETAALRLTSPPSPVSRTSFPRLREVQKKCLLYKILGQSELPPPSLLKTSNHFSTEQADQSKRKRLIEGLAPCLPGSPPPTLLCLRGIPRGEAGPQPSSVSPGKRGTPSLPHLPWGGGGGRVDTKASNSNLKEKSKRHSPLPAHHVGAHALGGKRGPPPQHSQSQPALGKNACRKAEVLKQSRQTSEFKPGFLSPR